MLLCWGCAVSVQVRVYDEATKTLQTTLSGGLGYQRVGHSNRVFSLKFCAQDDHMLLSAGWDNTVQVRLLAKQGHVCLDASLLVPRQVGALAGACRAGYAVRQAILA